eukprot:COSAG01_NODE_8516_length_2758_cov_1.104551_1_plen_109_part_00
MLVLPKVNYPISVEVCVLINTAGLCGITCENVTRWLPLPSHSPRRHGRTCSRTAELHLRPSVPASSSCLSLPSDERVKARSNWPRSPASSPTLVLLMLPLGALDSLRM